MEDCRAGGAWLFLLPTAMKLFVQSAFVFLGTLLAAALVALGAPGKAEVDMAVQAPPPEMVASLFGLEP
jgi:hypothetical protein